MTGAHGIDVQTLHNLDVLNHSLQADYISCIRIHLMAVSTLYEHGLPVHEKLLVLNFHLSETYFNWHLFNHFVEKFYLYHQCVQIWCFGSPFMRIADKHCDIAGSLSARHAVEFLAVGIVERIFNLQIIVDFLRFIDRESWFQPQNTILVLVVKVADYLDVVEMNVLVAGIEIILSCHTAQPPEVLVFTPRTVTPSECLESNKILAFLQIRRNVKLSCHFAVFGISGKLAVNIQIDI